MKAIKFKIQILPHQLLCNHSFEASHPCLLERCVKCKVYKFKWIAWTHGVTELKVKDGDLKSFEFESKY